MIREKIKIYRELSKMRITFSVFLTSIFGYILARGQFDFQMILPTLGVLFLSASSSALNHWQEPEIDKLMDRTKNRPLPQQKITRNHALGFVFITGIVGSSFLFIGGGLQVLLLGLLTFFTYNAIYTPMKKWSPYAVFPGGIVGAIPPMIGWVSGGGYVLSPTILALAFFFFVWQIPHFWLLLLLYGDDYRKAKLPTLSDAFSSDQLARMSYMWIVCLAMVTIMFPLFIRFENPMIIYMLSAISAWVAIDTFKLVKSVQKIFPRKVYRFSFIKVNLFVLLVMLILSVDKLI